MALYKMVRDTRPVCTSDPEIFTAYALIGILNQLISTVETSHNILSLFTVFPLSFSSVIRCVLKVWNSHHPDLHPPVTANPFVSLLWMRLKPPLLLTVLIVVLRLLGIPCPAARAV